MMRLQCLLCLAMALLLLSCQPEKRPEMNELYPVQMDKLYGFIDAQGKMVIPPFFFSVNWFQGNRAIVETTPGNKALIDRQGRIHFQDSTGFLHLHYENGLVEFDTPDKKSCFLDSLGNTRFCLGDSVIFAENAFSCERLLVRLRGGYFAYLDTEGKEVYRFRRGFPSPYKEDVARRNFNGRACYFDKNGKRLFCVQGSGMDFNSGRALIEKKGQLYFVDKKGEPQITRLPYDQIRSFENGFATVQKNKKYGMIDTTGKLAIPIEYDAVFPYSSEVFAVRPDIINGKWFFVNVNNEPIIDRSFDEVAAPGFIGELAYVRQDSTWGYINKKGDWVWKANFTPTQIFPR